MRGGLLSVQRELLALKRVAHPTSGRAVVARSAPPCQPPRILAQPSDSASRPLRDQLCTLLHRTPHPFLKTEERVECSGEQVRYRRVRALGLGLGLGCQHEPRRPKRTAFVAMPARSSPGLNCSNISVPSAAKRLSTSTPFSSGDAPPSRHHAGSNVPVATNAKAAQNCTMITRPPFFFLLYEKIATSTFDAKMSFALRVRPFHLRSAL